MPIQQIPLSAGIKREQKGLEYIDFMPSNMLAVPKTVLDSSGYFRSYPGLKKVRDVPGASRGVMFNSLRGSVYRVLGDRLFEGEADRGQAPQEAALNQRVNMAMSSTSVALAIGGLLRIYRYDAPGTSVVLANWPAGSGKPTYVIGSVSDVVRVRGRYIWSQLGEQRFGVTDLDDETHPDQFRPFYAAESQPDGILALGSWRDYVVCFGASSIEFFGLTGASDPASPIYGSQSSLLINQGIAGRYARCRFADAYAFVSGAANGQPGVYVMGTGEAQKVSTATVDRVLYGFTADQLSGLTMESFRIHNHELLVIHLPGVVLCYDASGSANGPQWCYLTTGLDGYGHRGIDYIWTGSAITVADKQENILGELDSAIASQYDTPSEHYLASPLLKLDNKRLFDLEIESAGGGDSVDNIFISSTSDGLVWGQERRVPFNAPYNYNRRVIWQRLGRVAKNIGFRFRLISSSPVTVSDLRVRIE